MRTAYVFLLLVLLAGVGCTKRNPAVCCVTPSECLAVGFETPSPCAEGVCVANACVASGCDGNEDCSGATPVCMAGQCVAIDAAIEPADWVVRYGSDGNDSGAAIAVESNGDLVVTGNFQKSISVGGAALVAAGTVGGWVARYNSSGTLRWSVSLGNASAVAPGSASVDGSGDIYVTGIFVGQANFGTGLTSLNGGTFIVKLAGKDGTPLWDHEFQQELISNLITLDDGHIAISGLFTGTADFGGGGITATPAGAANNLLVVFDTTAGNFVWAKALPLSADESIAGCHISVTGGDLVVASTFQGTVMLGGAPLTAMGNDDIYIARFRGSDGSHVWSVSHGSTGNTTATTIAANDNDVFVGGNFTQTTNLGGSNLVAQGTPDAFVAAYRSADGSPMWSNRYGANDGLYDVYTLAASSSKLAVAISIEVSSITVGMTTFIPQNKDLALVSLQADTGVPGVAASQFSSTASDSPLAVELSLVYINDHLAGTGAFLQMAKLFGSNLISAGGQDIVVFRVDF